MAFHADDSYENDVVNEGIDNSNASMDSGENESPQGRLEQSKDHIDDNGMTSEVRQLKNADNSYPTKRKLDDSSSDSEDPTGNHSTKKPHLVDEVKELYPDLGKFWSAVEQDPNDFTAWTHLLQYVDQVTQLSIAGEAYDAFLQKYPYCYGYWKKYSDFAKRRGSPADVEQIFQRGLQSIPLSVDLWIHYLTYIKSAYENDEALIRSKFDLGIETCGLEFRSDKLWEQYAQWEAEIKNWKNSMGVWDQILNTPTQALKKHLEKVIEFIKEQDPSEIVSKDEYSNLVNEIKAEGENISNDEIVEKLREKIIQARVEIHDNTAEEVKIRSAFEDGIKRPYFHVKPVEKNQLRNWVEYLDFEIEKGNRRRILTLFERCLIACAMYAEYWEKYVKFLHSEHTLDVKKLREIYTRITTVHHPKIVAFTLDFAAFEEMYGEPEKVTSIYESLVSSNPTTFLAFYRHIMYERRGRNLKKCCELFETYINKSKDSDKSLSLNLLIKYAQFLKQEMGSNGVIEAIRLLKAILASSLQEASKVLMVLIDIGLSTSPINEELVLYAFDFGIQQLDSEEKLKFARRKIEYLEDHTKEIGRLLIAHREYHGLLNSLKVEKKPHATLVHSTKVSNPETPKTGSTTPTASLENYDYNSNSNPGYPPSDFAQYAEGQYSTGWNSQTPPTAGGDSAVYGQSYVNQPNSWNSFYA